jgi:hypothetical protein
LRDKKQQPLFIFFGMRSAQIANKKKGSQKAMKAGNITEIVTDLF